MSTNPDRTSLAALDLDNSPAVRSAREFLSEDEVEAEAPDVSTVLSDDLETEIEFEDAPDPNRTLFTDEDEETTDDDGPPGLQDRPIIDSSSETESDVEARRSVIYASPFNLRRSSGSRRDTLAELRAQARAQVEDLSTQVFHRERRVAFDDRLPTSTAPAPAPVSTSGSTSTSATSGGQGENGSKSNTGTSAPPKSDPTSKPLSRRSAKHLSRRSRRASGSTPGPGARMSTGYAVVGGSTLKTRPQPADPDSVQITKTWYKHERVNYDAEERAAFKKSATGYALSKSNKLSLIEIDPKGGTDALSTIRNLKVQMNLIKSHLRDHDMHDVIENIVVPIDLRNSSATKNVMFNLFDDHRRLDASMVAASNAWYNLWVDEKFISDNMTYTFTFLQNNTSEALWNLCLEDYEEYHPVSKGGPLVFFLVPRRLQNSSESAMQNLREQVKNLKIRDIPGENVDVACSLIKAAHNALVAASSDDRNFVPDDFLGTVLKALQSTSVSKFNKIFATIEDEVTRASDRTGLQPDWPELTEIMTTAKNAYRRMCSSSAGWHTSNAQKQRGLTSTPSGSNLEPDCWNCHGKHKVQDCPKPRDERRIADNRRKMMAKIREARKQRAERKAAHKASTSTSTNKKTRRRKTRDDGTPLILNVKGQWVIDQGLLREQKKTAQLAELKDTPKGICTSSSDPSSAPPAAPAPAADPEPDTAASAQLAKIDSALEKLFG